MTDTEAITLLQSLITEAQTEENDLTQAYTDLDNAKTDVENAINGVTTRLSSFSKNVNYAIDHFNI